MPSYQPFKKRTWESKQQKTGKNQQSNDTISKSTSMEKTQQAL